MGIMTKWKLDRMPTLRANSKRQVARLLILVSREMKSHPRHQKKINFELESVVNDPCLKNL